MKFINSNDRFVRKEYKISLSESTSNRTIDSGMLEEEFSVVDEGPEENPNPDNLFGITLENLLC